MGEVFNRIKVEPLIKLRDYFKTLPFDYGKFNMKKFAVDNVGNYIYAKDVPECGTSMCLLGHLPVLGYPGLEGESWRDYGSRVLDISMDRKSQLRLPQRLVEDGYIWEYLFSADWPDDISLAIQRLDDVINKRKSVIAVFTDSIDICVDNYNKLFDSIE